MSEEEKKVVSHDSVEETEKKEQSNDIQIVSGDGTDLDISPVYEHIEIEKPTNIEHNKKNIIIPPTKK